jgi:hypothetical protein
MTTKIDLDRVDAVIARTLAAAPHLGVVMHAVKAGLIRYIEICDGRAARVLGLRRQLPVLLLVCDQAGRGPAYFDAALIARTCRRVCGITLVVDQQQQIDDVAYVSATEHCIARRQPVMVVETHRSALREWVELARACGKSDGDVVVITADPDQPEGLEQIDLDDLAKAPPRGPVH